MEAWKVKLVKALEKSGKSFVKTSFYNLKFDKDFLINEKEDLLNDTNKAIKWFVGETFWQGRSDWLSNVYRRAFSRSFDKIYSNEAFSKVSFDKNKVESLIEEFEREVEKLKKKSGESYKLNKKDIRRLEALFSNFLPKLEVYQFNPVKFIVEETQKGHLKELFEKNLIIWGIGPKVRALILRGIVQVFDLEEYVKEEDKKDLFPVDTHVRQICQLIWPETEGKNDRGLAKFVVEQCQKLRVSPLNFNSGCWILGSTAQEAFNILMNQLLRSRR